MPYSVTFDAEDKLILLKLQGTVTLPVVTEMISDLIRIAKEHHCDRILNDAREADLDLTTLQIYDLPRVASEMLSSKGLPIFKLSRAIVVSEHVKDFAFFETVSLNTGQNVKLFHDVQEAKKWLLRE